MGGAKEKDELRSEHWTGALCHLTITTAGDISIGGRGGGESRESGPVTEVPLGKEGGRGVVSRGRVFRGLVETGWSQGPVQNGRATQEFLILRKNRRGLFEAGGPGPGIN